MASKDIQQVTSRNRQNINSIVNKLIKLEHIPYQLIDQLQIFGGDSQTYAGLINLLYNTVVKRDRPAKSEMEAERPETWTNGSVLHMRGEILREYAQFLAPFIPEPAYSLVRFDYASFSEYCSKRGLLDLVRHATGLYPQIDTKKTRPLQFLPFYDQIDQSQPALLGNMHWSLARKLLSQHYDQLKKKDAFDANKSGLQLGEETGIGVRLCYILLAGREDQMQEYISNLAASISKGAQGEEAVIKSRLRLWHENYSKFLSEGLQYYLNPKQSQGFPLIYDMEGNNFEQVIIKLIGKIVTPRQVQNFDSSIREPRFANFQWLLTYALNNKFVPRAVQNMEDQSEGELVHTPKMLFLAYIKTLAKQLGIQLQDKQDIDQIYRDLCTHENSEEEPFNRFFLSDGQLLELYASGRVREYPSQYIYSPDIMQKILKFFIRNNPSKFAANLRHIEQLPKSEQLRMVALNGLIGDVYAIDTEGGQTTPGESVLNYLEKNLTKLLGLSKAQEGTDKAIRQYISTWRDFYKLYRQMSPTSLQKQLQNKVMKLRMPEAELPQKEGLSITELVNPFQRPGIYYYFVRKAVRLLRDILNKCARLQQVQNASMHESELSALRAQLTKWLSVFRYQSFKYMVLEALPDQSQPFSAQDLRNLEVRARKQLFEDYVWSTFSEALLVSNEQTSKLLGTKPEVPEKKPLFSIPSPFVFSQPPGSSLFGKVGGS